MTNMTKLFLSTAILATSAMASESVIIEFKGGDGENTIELDGEIDIYPGGKIQLAPGTTTTITGNIIFHNTTGDDSQFIISGTDSDMQSCINLRKDQLDYKKLLPNTFTSEILEGEHEFISYLEGLMQNKNSSDSNAKEKALTAIEELKEAVAMIGDSTEAFGPLLTMEAFYTYCFDQGKESDGTETGISYFTSLLNKIDKDAHLGKSASLNSVLANMGITDSDYQYIHNFFMDNRTKLQGIWDMTVGDANTTVGKKFATFITEHQNALKEIKRIQPRFTDDNITQIKDEITGYLTSKGSKIYLINAESNGTIQVKDSEGITQLATEGTNYSLVNGAKIEEKGLYTSIQEIQQRDDFADSNVIAVLKGKNENTKQISLDAAEDANNNDANPLSIKLSFANNTVYQGSIGDDMTKSYGLDIKGYYKFSGDNSKFTEGEVNIIKGKSTFTTADSLFKNINVQGGTMIIGEENNTEDLLVPADTIIKVSSRSRDGKHIPGKVIVNKNVKFAKGAKLMFGTEIPEDQEGDPSQTGDHNQNDASDQNNASGQNDPAQNDASGQNDPTQNDASGQNDDNNQSNNP